MSFAAEIDILLLRWSLIEIREPYWGK